MLLHGLTNECKLVVTLLGGWRQTYSLSHTCRSQRNHKADIGDGKGGAGIWQDGLLLLSVRQLTVERVRSQENRRWLIHRLTSRLRVEMCVCGLQDTQWMTDWQGHRWARLHQHRRLRRCVHPPFTHHSQLEQSCDCLCLQWCFTVSCPVMVVLFQNLNRNHFICQVQ